MKELYHVIYHFLGVCGEGHPSFWWVLVGSSTSISGIWYYVKYKWLGLANDNEEIKQ